MLENNNNSTINITAKSIGPDQLIIELYTFPFIVIIGTICNILIFLVMTSKKMRHQSTYFYMGVLAIADEMVLLNGCLNVWIIIYFGESLLFTQLGCKILGTIYYTASHFSVWIVVAMTIERFRSRELLRSGSNVRERPIFRSPFQTVFINIP